MKVVNYDIIVIGGSAGSIPIVAAILEGLPNDFATPIVLILHRQKNVASEMTRIFQLHLKNIKVTEPEDKEFVAEHHVYLAPQNYHLLVEQDRSFSLDYSEAVHYSRPSIDVSFESFSRVYGSKMLGVLLSGANQDGTRGLETIIANKGKAMIQDPETAEYPVMVRSAAEKCKKAMVYSPGRMVEYISKITNR